MRLHSCYIAGFGKFVDRSFDFSSDLTVFKEDNGWGKTTLADFLKCMLYGMDNGRGKSIGANERLKYEPWNGNAYGGSLIFSCGGKRYRVERSFGKTVAADTARIYDENNMPTYEFGDKAERLGEVLFGVDRESYQRSVYIPQGAADTGGLPDEVKTRLLVLLGNGGADDNGADRAVERLDAAERALRARRSPKNGKLDVIDERLAQLTRQKATCEEYAVLSAKTEEELKALSADIHACGERLKGLDATIEQINRQNELATKQELYAELQSQKNALRRETEKMQMFFGKIDPKTVNLQGLQTAITEFYTLKKEIGDLEERLYKTEGQARERATALARASQLEQTIARCQRDWAQNNEKQARKAEKNVRRKQTHKKRKFTGLRLFLSFLAIVVGAVFVDTRPIYGYPLLIFGALVAAISFLKALPPKRSKDKSDEVEVMSMIEYQQAEGELAGLNKALKAFPADLEERRQTLVAAREEKKGRADGLEKAIGDFLRNFSFEETYDYRASLATLKNCVDAMERLSQETAHCDEKMRALTGGADGNEVVGVKERLRASDLERYKAQRRQAEGVKDELLARHAALSAKSENYAEKARKGDLEAEEERLTEEKTRLEKKLYAIQEAKKFLLRAKENMATRYLDPVGRNCERYLATLGADAATIRFAADGSPLFEESGVLHTTECYSAGWKELVWFCTRLSLVQAIFEKEPPTLVLDDPFSDLDDKKTEKAKKLVKELSGRYQIIYFTCKKERAL